MSSRLAVLALLASWSALLTVESWLRPPVASAERDLPEQLQRSGRLYRRLPPADPSPADLPAGLVLVAAANYSPQSPATAADPAVIRLRLVVHTRSGTSGAIPVEVINTALAGPTERGRCVELDANGVVTAEFPTSAALSAWNRSRSVPAIERLAWLAGLRPYQSHRCLWLGF